MAIAAGRDMLLMKATVAIATLRVTKLSFGLDPIDISSADDAGLRKLFTVYSGQRFTITAEGVEKDRVLAGIWVDPTAAKYLTDMTLALPTMLAANDLFSGDMLMTAFELTGDYKDAVMFTTTLESAGTWAGS